MAPTPAQGFAYLTTSRAFSNGVIALPGHILHRIQLKTPLPLEAGLTFAANLIEHPATLCGVELRIPRRLSAEEFNHFNRRYIAALQASGFPTDPTNPAARTNVVPIDIPPTEPVLTAFTFAQLGISKTLDFLLSGKPELGPNGVIAPNSTSTEAIIEKALSVLNDLRTTALELGASPGATTLHIYTRHALHPIADLLAHAAYEHIPSDPPTEGPDNVPFEFEADLRRITREETIEPTTQPL